MAPANPTVAPSAATDVRRFVTYDTHPDRYAHWKLAFDGPVATLTMDVDEDRGIQAGYNYQFDNGFLIGVEGDWSFGKLHEGDEGVDSGFGEGVVDRRPDAAN